MTHHNSVGPYTSNFTCNAEIYPKHLGMKHPFISTYNRGYGANGNNVCMGDMMVDIIQSFLKLDWTSMGYWIDIWLNTYKVGVTGPLNDIRYSSLGKQTILLEGKDVSSDYYDVVSHVDSGICWDQQASTLRNIDESIDWRPKAIEQCNDMNCELRSTCEGYKANTTDIALQSKLDKYISDECSFETLLPSDQEYEEDYIYYSNLLSEAVYGVGNIRVPWELISNAIQNKAFLVVSRLLETMLNENIVKVYDDDSIHEDTVSVIVNGQSHEDICKDLTLLRGKPESLSDEQNDMLDWVAAMRQQYYYSINL